MVKHRRLFIILFELALVAACNYVAFLIRFDAEIPSFYFDLLIQTLPIVVTIRGLLFMPFRLYEGLWRYTSLWDLRNIASAVLLSSAAIYVLVNPVMGLAYPRGILFIDALVLVCAMTGIRLSRRIWREVGSRPREKGVLIYGAGDAGEMVVRDMRNNPFYMKDPIGFIDDNSTKVGRRIHGVPVLGTSKDLKKILDGTTVNEILIAMPNASPQELRRVLTVLEPFKIPITTLPSLRDLLDGKVTVSQIRNLAFEDLLHRNPVGLDAKPVQDLISRRRVMVTGAGGSIGSELCRQILRMDPELLIMAERHEPSVYFMQKELSPEFGNKLVARLVDVADRDSIRAVMAECQPHIVFHAAAYKHVPLMEENPCAAIKNNVTGSRIVAEEAKLAGVERFILISSDKAVNPSSVMGATKRVAELVTQNLAVTGNTCFNVVRFGNVLGSSGSVVPLFLDQIRAGGPVTVTHPEMRRYFMLIPEAVQLVLHAATLGDSGTVYVLDMGDEFKVVDLARNLIRLSGYVPDEEIPIEFTGLRPGEKLSEVLVGVAETVQEAAEKIQRVRAPRPIDPEALKSAVTALELAAVRGQSDEVIRLLQQIVPTFTPDSISNPSVPQAKTASN